MGTHMGGDGDVAALALGTQGPSWGTAAALVTPHGDTRTPLYGHGGLGDTRTPPWGHQDTLIWSRWPCGNRDPRHGDEDVRGSAAPSPPHGPRCPCAVPCAHCIPKLSPWPHISIPSVGHSCRPLGHNPRAAPPPPPSPSVPSVLGSARVLESETGGDGFTFTSVVGGEVSTSGLVAGRRGRGRFHFRVGSR